MGDPKLNFKNYKQRGEWVEMRFMARAAEEGLQVSKPYGESAAYDFIVEHASRCLRIQVKSTIHKRPSGHHSCPVHASNNRLYPEGAFDFAAILLIPLNVWYLIPLAQIIGRRSAFFTPGLKTSKFGQYEEAWHLLTSDQPAAR